MKLEAFEKVVSRSFNNTSTERISSNVFIDLSLFWDIIESSFVSELPTAANSYFGSSLLQHRQVSQTGEILRSRLLPEPTRINSEGVTPVAAVFGAGSAMSPSTASAAQVPAAWETMVDDFIPPMDDELAILAQSYFAQGQDFVGSMDDGWFTSQPA
jgi:hypothetical protein